MKTQSGRSMIEIIGVLAVMGVLSIAVLYLYPYLVAHHKSNETWNDVLVQATVVQTSHTDDTFAAIKIVDGEELPSLITSEEFKTSAVGYPMEVYKTNDVQFIVQVDNVDYDACEIMLKKHSLVPDAIEVGNSKFEPIQENYDICGTSGTKTMYFYFGFCNGDINAVCDGGCGENFECFCGRCWCPTVGADPQTCQCPKNYDTIDGECVCPEGRQLPEGVCCPKGEHADNGICCPKDEYNSKGICCLDDLLNGSHLWITQEFWNDDGEEELKCVCQRTCDEDFVLNETSCTCECPTGDLTTDDECCPVGRHADGDICCEEGQYNSEGICCEYGDYNSNGVCCSAELFDDEQTNRWIGQNGECVCNLNCQNDLVHNAECTACVCSKTCENGFVLNKTNCTCECPMDKPYSYDGQCNVCPEDKPEQGKDGICRIPCPSGWSVGIDQGYCFKNLGRKTASGAATACKNAGGFLPTLWQAKNYLGGNRSLLVSDQRGNRCGKNLVTYYWIANIGNVKNTHTNLSCTNANGYAFVASNGEECHPNTSAPTFCLRKR